MTTPTVAKIAVRFRAVSAAPPLPAGVRTGARLPPKTTLPDTLKRLGAELSELAAQNVWLETGHDASDIRPDGHLQTGAKTPATPTIAVRLWAGVAADGEPVGALKIVCGTYADWQGNLWAVAQTLEKLRTLAALGTIAATDLYTLFADDSPGASEPDAPREKSRPRPKKSRPRPVPTQTAAPTWDETKQNAARLLLREAGEDDHFRFAALLLRNAASARRVFIAATKNAHPDGGGTDERMRGVQEAWHVLRG